MLAPDLQFMVHTAEIVDEEGYAHRGSRLTLVEKDPRSYPEWKVKDFAFAAFSSAGAAGLKRIHFGLRAIWAFASPRDHCQELVVFRKGCDTRKKWDEDKLHEPNKGLDMFFIMRMRQITSETPLFKQFNGEWGFWESFYVPILSEQHNMKVLSLMDPSMCEDYFSPKRLPVTCYTCPSINEVLTIPDDLEVRYEVKIAVKEMEEWTDLCNKISDDMIMTDKCCIQYKHLLPGDECIDAYHETSGLEMKARLVKRDFEQLKLPIIATFEANLNVKKDWDPDRISLEHKFDSVGTVYSQNLQGGFSSLSGARSDPWNPMARLAVNAITKLLSRYPDIRTVMDVGCGDMAWMQYILQENPALTYIGVDMTPHVLATNFRRFPKMQFVQTDLSNLTGIEVMPRGVDLVIAKDLFNHMVLPDALAAMKRVIATRPRFLLTHIHEAADNTGWEKRIDKHLHYTRYDYNKPPFSMPYPATDIQRISEEAYFVLYEITPEDTLPPPPRIERTIIPEVGSLEGFSLVAEGEYLEAGTTGAPGAYLGTATTFVESSAESRMEKKPAGEKTILSTPVTELPDKVQEEKVVAERKPIKGIPAVEFKARCDLIFEKFDKDRDLRLKFEELAAVMESGGRPVKAYDDYASLCKKLGSEPAAGLTKKNLQTMFEKAPQKVWDEASNAMDPLAQMVMRGVEKMPLTFLERPLPYWLFEDGEQFANVYIEINAHLFHGAAECVDFDKHVQAYFGTKRLEVHICAPGSFGSKDLYLWKLVVSPLSYEVVADDCQLKMEETTGRFGAKKITLKLMKAAKKKWYKVGQTVSGNRKGDGGC